MNDSLGSVPCRAAWLGTPVRPPHGSFRQDSPPPLRSLITAWRERIRLRRKLARMAQANPHLIDDIGLTLRQVEAEIAKPFWQE